MEYTDYTSYIDSDCDSVDASLAENIADSLPDGEDVAFYLKEYKKYSKYLLPCVVTESLNNGYSDFVFSLKDLERVIEICRKAKISFIYRIVYDKRGIDYIEFNPTRYIFTQYKKGIISDFIYSYDEIPLNCFWIGKAPDIIKKVGYTTWEKIRREKLINMTLQKQQVIQNKINKNK